MLDTQASSPAGPGAPPAALAKFERLALVSTRALSVVGLLALMVLAFMTLANGLTRWAMNMPLAGVVDVSGLATAIAVACCLPVALVERGHIAFRLVSSLSPRLGRVLDVLAGLAVQAVLVVMAIKFYGYAGSLAASGETTYVLKWPTAPFWFGVDAIMWMAVLVQCVVIVSDVVRLFTGAPAAAATS